MYLGLDLGTSSVKAMLVDDAQRVVGQASAPLTVQQPRPLWSEQDPQAWWAATQQAVEVLRAAHGAGLAAVRGIGLSGQMHGATLLDADDRVLRPCILWNDGRSAAECVELERRVPRLRAIAGNQAMPGFTAPKLLWVAAHEPDVFRATARVLLPKDWLRLRLSGEAVSEMSDAAGTLWLDVAQRAWSAELLAATGLDEGAMPRLIEGSAPSGLLRHDVAAGWGMSDDVVVAGGGGDNAAGAVGVGVVQTGDAFLSLGTSGVLFVVTAHCAPAPQRGVHAFCHALPDTWHQMSVILSAASCLRWLSNVSGGAGEATLLAEVEQAARPAMRQTPLFLPYLSGERTPHNDPEARGAIVGLTQATRRADLTRAVLEGVAFAFADGQDALTDSGTAIGRVAVISGGAHSRLWGGILADVLERPLEYRAGGELGSALGAARLARLAVTGEAVADVCTPPPLLDTIEPDASTRQYFATRRGAFRALYPALQAIAQ
ncbi:MAG: xylulokinase [bacterium]